MRKAILFLIICAYVGFINPLFYSLKTSHRYKIDNNTYIEFLKQNENETIDLENETIDPR